MLLVMLRRGELLYLSTLPAPVQPPRLVILEYEQAVVKQNTFSTEVDSFSRGTKGRVKVCRFRGSLQFKFNGRDSNIMQLFAGRSVQVRASQCERSRSVIACPSNVIAANRAPIAVRQPSAHSSGTLLQQHSLRSQVLARSTPIDAASALKAPGQHLQQVS